MSERSPAARRIGGAWRSDHNTTRLHTNLDRLTPAAFATRSAARANREQALLMNEGTLGAGSVRAQWCCSRRWPTKKAALLGENGVGWEVLGMMGCGDRQPPTVADRMPGLRPLPSTASQGHSAIQLRSQPGGPMAFPRTRSADHDHIEGQDGAAGRTATRQFSVVVKDASRSPEPLRAAVLGGAKGPPAP